MQSPERNGSDQSEDQSSIESGDGRTANQRRREIVILLLISTAIAVSQIFIHPITTTLDSSEQMNRMSLLSTLWTAALFQ